MVIPKNKRFGGGKTTIPEGRKSFHPIFYSEGGENLSQEQRKSHGRARTTLGPRGIEKGD